MRSYLIIGSRGQRLWLYEREPTAAEVSEHEKQDELCAGPQWCEALANAVRVLGGEVVSLTKTEVKK